MLRKRIIFVLIYEAGFFNQSRNFRLQQVGNLRWLEENYKFKEIAFSIDELIVLDAGGQKDIATFANLISGLVEDVFIPIAAGGGIRSEDDASMLFANGADKIVINTACVDDPKLITSLVKCYGSQSIIASIDYCENKDAQHVMVNNGTKKLEMSLHNYIKYLQELGVGEIYLNSVNRDGTGFGYDLSTVNALADIVKVPLIVAGGAGNASHLKDGLMIEHVSAVATANLFNFIGDGLPKARQNILNDGVNIAQWR